MKNPKSNTIVVPDIWLKLKGRGGPSGQESEMIIDAFVTDMKRIGPYLSKKPPRTPVRPRPEERRKREHGDDDSAVS